MAEEVNARCAISLIGSLVTADAKIWHARNIGDEAFRTPRRRGGTRHHRTRWRPPRARLWVFEIYPFSVNDTPANIRRLLDAVDRDHFGVHMDLVNLVNCPRAYFGNAALLAESLRLFGDRIVSAHAKDIAMARGEGAVDVGGDLRGPGGGAPRPGRHRLRRLFCAACTGCRRRCR